MSTPRKAIRLHGVDMEQLVAGEGKPMAGYVECLNFAIYDSSGGIEALANLEPAQVRRLRDYLTGWLETSDQDELRKQVRG